MIAVNWSNMTDLSQIPAQANVVTGGFFWMTILYMLFVILLLIIMAYGFEVSLITSSFLCLVIGLLMVFAGLLAWIWVLPFIAAIIFYFLYTTYIKNKT